MDIFSDLASTFRRLKYGEPKLTSHLDVDVIDSINNGELVSLDVKKDLFLAPGEKCYYADDAYKCDGKKGFMEYRFITGTLFITNKRIILSAPGGFDYPLHTLTYTKEYDDGILFQFGEKLIVMGIATSRQAYKVLEMLR